VIESCHPLLTWSSNSVVLWEVSLPTWCLSPRTPRPLMASQITSAHADWGLVVLGYFAGNKSMLDVTGMVPTKIPKHLEITESITLKAYIVVFGFWNSQYVSTRGVRFGLLPFFWSVVAACCGLELPCPHTTRNRFYVFFGAYLQRVVDPRNRFLRGHRRGGNTLWESNGRPWWFGKPNTCTWSVDQKNTNSKEGHKNEKKRWWQGMEHWKRFSSTKCLITMK